jgi:uncharacterized protein (UPF0335 family)
MTADEQLRAIVERYESLATEKQELSDWQRDILAEAKEQGYDTKAIREVIRLRKMDRDARAEMEALTELYFNALEGDE